ncbi:MAG: MMPL family transporter [Gammaproteobacteria bacterium]|nr:MMPL family transporter [Gammaproteobacteria bacterium]MCP5198718.1 MMPL family transporter [Gammaproteobacteria bacterium]
MRFVIAAWVMKHRVLVSILFVLVTIGFSLGIPKVDIRTIFNDLLPRNDPFTQVYFDHRNFGNPMMMAIMVKRKDGDIYNAETLAKVWDITRDIDLAPHVNHDQILSISTEKLRYAEATTDGIDTKPLMDDHPPATPEEIAEFKRRVMISPSAMTFFISRDETAALINATFHDTIEYGESFAYAQKLVEAARDEHHEVYLAGQPVLTGWVYKLQKQTYFIFGITLGLLVIALVLYMRNIAGVATPIICAAVAGLWGFGFIGWLERAIEPLLMIVPLLLVARSFSHCVQYTERYYEVLLHVGDRRKAAEITMGIMMAPSILGVITDFCGIVFIAIAPIQTMVNHAIFCGMWALFIIPTGTFLCSILLSYLPVPKNIEGIVGGKDKESGIHLLQEKALLGLARLSQGKLAHVTALVMVAIAAWALYLNSQIKIGNPVEGSNLLWHDSEFNTAVRAINAHFPGTNTLEIVLEAKTEDIDHRIANTPGVVAVHAQLQRLLESDPELPPRATLSWTDYMSETNRLFSGGNPKWAPLDLTNDAINAASFGALLGSNAINFGHVADFEFQNSTVSLWYKDNKQETVDHALAAARKAVDIVGIDHDEFTVRLGTGVIALQQAVNNTVEKYHWIIIGMVNLAVMLLATFAYRSIIAALILLIPVNLSNVMLVAAMELVGVGLDINAGIVAVMGVGVGIDYGIYLLSRICEEYTAHDHDLARALTAALTTTGKAIMFTASIMLLGIVPWYFLSDLKFMADMGLLLVVVMVINMVLSLVVLPLLVWYFKPGFMARQDLLVGENVDISQFTTT